MTTTYKDILCKNLKISDESIKDERAEQLEQIEKYFEEERLLYCNYDSYYKVTTITVAEMIEALNKLAPDAKLVMTESGFHSRREFARVFLPEPYIVGTHKSHPTDLPNGTQVYCIGHSHHIY
jgi:hypothetical protein